MQRDLWKDYGERFVKLFYEETIYHEEIFRNIFSQND